MDKVKAFEPELSLIKDVLIKEFAINAIKILPDYFFETPASSTGKYHPAYSLGNGGLLRHSKAAVRIAVELARLEWWHFSDEEVDLALVALMLHDGWKHGEQYGKYSIAEHPTVATFALENNEDLQQKRVITDDQFQTIVSCIKTHMGQWVTHPRTQEVILQKPQTPLQKFVHLSDYIASRKCLTMEFDVPLSR